MIFFYKLDEATGGWSTKILGAIAAWKLLNLEFLATPLGMILGGLLAILALYDDFEVWKEGGISFFNWAPVVPIINDVVAVVHDLYEGLSDMFAILFDLIGAFSRLIHLDWGGFKNNIQNAFGDIKTYIQDAYKYAKDLFTLISGGITGLSSVAGYIGGLFGGNAPQTNPSGINQPQPLLPSNTNTSNKIDQQTTINVNGAADAHAVGRQVAGQQNLVNFNLTRNLAGRTQ